MKSRTKRIVHPILKLMIRTTASFYFEKVDIKGVENIPTEGPAIFACNHPNSFLDALIITFYYRRPLYYVARGDAFKKPFAAKVLSFLNNIPIFRKEEGTHNLSKNEESFSYCLDILKEGDTILLFAEGVCENEWFLRPLRKGAARIVYEAWNDPAIGDKLKVIPIANNYSSWHGSGNNISVELLEPMEKSTFTGVEEQGQFLRKFNDVLFTKLSEKVVSIDKSKDVEAQNIVTGFIIKNLAEGEKRAKEALAKFKDGTKDLHAKYLQLAHYIKQEKLVYYDEAGGNAIAFLVALFIIPFTFILNIIPYSVCKYIAEKTTRRNVFYDSVFFGSLLVFGPIYMLTIGILAVHFTHSMYGFLLPLLAMLSAWSYEPAKRNIYCFLQRKKFATVSIMLNALFEKGNG